MSDVNNTEKVQQMTDSVFNIQGKKHFVFNQTGNVMMSSTDPDGKDIPREVRDVFAEVSVFFAAMTKSISQTINPLVVNKINGIDEPVYYSLYDYDAISSIVKGSSYFIHMTEQDLKYNKTSRSMDVNIPTEIVSGVLGLAIGDAITPIARSMVSSVGKRAEKLISFSWKSDSEKTSNKVANIIFVCEYIMGMPMVSAIVLSLSMKEVSNSFSAGPCYRDVTHTIDLDIHKDVYSFVTPKFIKKFADDLNNTMDDENLVGLISHLKTLVSREAYFSKFSTITEGEVEEGEELFVIGEYFGKEVSLKIIDNDNIVLLQDKVSSTENSFRCKVQYKNREKIDDDRFTIEISGQLTNGNKSYKISTKSLKLVPKPDNKAANKTNRT